MRDHRMNVMTFLATALFLINTAEAQFVLNSPQRGGTVCSPSSPHVIKVTVDNLTWDGFLTLSVRKTDAQCGAGSGVFGNPEWKTGGRIEIRDGSINGRAVAGKDYAYGDPVVQITFRPDFEISYRDYYAVVSSDPNLYWDGPVSVRSFDLARNVDGIRLYKLVPDPTVAGAVPDYVAEINLSRAEIRSLLGPESGTASSGSASQRSKYVQSRSITQHWDAAKNSTVAPYLMVNFSFFDLASTVRTLSFPVKVNGRVVSYGFELTGGTTGGGRYSGQYRYLLINNPGNSVSIGTIQHTSPSTLANADALIDNSANQAGQEFLGSISRDACIECTTNRARVFMSTADRNGDGRPELLIYASEKATNNYAQRMLEHFKGSTANMLQADGGSSAQLVVADPTNMTVGTSTLVGGKLLVRGDGGSVRAIPHVIAVYPGIP